MCRRSAGSHAHCWPSWNRENWHGSSNTSMFIPHWTQSANFSHHAFQQRTEWSVSEALNEGHTRKVFTSSRSRRIGSRDTCRLLPCWTRKCHAESSSRVASRDRKTSYFSWCVRGYGLHVRGGFAFLAAPRLIALGKVWDRGVKCKRS